MDRAERIGENRVMSNRVHRAALAHLLGLALVACGGGRTEGAGGDGGGTDGSRGDGGGDDGGTVDSGVVDGGSGLDNPDGLAAATQIFYTRDFDSQADADVLASAVVTMSYQATGGYQGSGAWRALPQPISAAANEDNVGWTGGAPVAVDQARRVVYSYLLYISDDLMQDIVTAPDPGSGNWFWNHGNKIIDVLQWNASGTAADEVNGNTRYVIKVRRNGPPGSPVRFSHLNGGAGNEYFSDGVNPNPNLATMTDEWFWVAHALDEQARTITTYVKRQGDAGVTRCLVRDSTVDLGTGALASDGRGFVAGRNVWGYWDDIIDASASSTKYVAIDRLRIADGWIAPPF